jgi:hypothetical protein
MEGIRRLLQPVIDGLDELSLHVLPSERFGKLRVCYSCTTEEQRALSSRLAAGFAMLEQRAPMWHRRVQEELKHVVVLRMGPDVGGGWYDSASRVCSVNATPLLEHDTSFAPISAMFILVHETTHAWLSRHNVHLEGERGRIREEEICNSAEASLAARFPEMPGLAEKVAQRRAAIAGNYSDPGVSARSARVRGSLLEDIFGSWIRPA